jgi:hypothetical protein
MQFQIRLRGRDRRSRGNGVQAAGCQCERGVKHWICDRPVAKGKVEPEMKVGYARVSTTEQDLSGQLAALKEAGCTRVYSEVAAHEPHSTLTRKIKLLALKDKTQRPARPISALSKTQ